MIKFIVYCTLVYCMVVTSRIYNYIYPAQAVLQLQYQVLREHAYERYVDPDSMFRNELVLTKLLIIIINPT